MRHNGRKPGRPEVLPRRGGTLGDAVVEREVVSMTDDDWALFQKLIQHYRISGASLVRYLLRREGERIEASVKEGPS
jgi:hypothetical protein